MAQNLISLEFTPEQKSQIEAALSTLEQLFGGLISLSPDSRRRLHKMGEKSELFCRQSLEVLVQNPQIVPPSLDVAESMDDLHALDVVRPFRLRLTRLAERASDTEMALGSDIMDAALQGYVLLKYAGKEQGLDALRKQLGTRWSKPGRKDKTVAEPDPPA